MIYNSLPSPPVITSPLAAAGSLSAIFSYAITATNYPTSFFVIGLPPGLWFNPAMGTISGIPAATGNFTVILRALNSGGTGAASLALTINPESPPAIQSISTGNGITLSFLTLTNRLYDVEEATNLTDSNWAGLFTGIIGNGEIQTVIDSNAIAPFRFYRLKVYPHLRNRSDNWTPPPKKNKKNKKKKKKRKKKKKKKKK